LAVINPFPTSTYKPEHRTVDPKVEGSSPFGDQEVDILAFADNGLLRYANFHINLAAGLEDGLIAELNPEWNGKRNKKALIASKPRILQAPKCETSDVPIKDLASQVRKYRGKYDLHPENCSIQNAKKNVIIAF